jgi:hypothetical protein
VIVTPFRRGLAASARGNDVGRPSGAAHHQRVRVREIDLQLVRSPAGLGVNRPAFGAQELERGNGKVVGNHYAH